MYNVAVNDGHVHAWCSVDTASPLLMAQEQPSSTAQRYLSMNSEWNLWKLAIMSLILSSCKHTSEQHTSGLRQDTARMCAE